MLYRRALVGLIFRPSACIQDSLTSRASKGILYTTFRQMGILGKNIFRCLFVLLQYMIFGLPITILTSFIYRYCNSTYMQDIWYIYIYSHFIFRAPGLYARHLCSRAHSTVSPSACDDRRIGYIDILYTSASSVLNHSTLEFWDFSKRAPGSIFLNADSESPPHDVGLKFFPEQL